MKKMSLFVTVIALVLAVAASAFKAAPAAVKDTTQWYEYDGSGDIHSAENYSPIMSPSCDGPGDLCAVLVNVDENGPDFSTFLDSRNKDQ